MTATAVDVGALMQRVASVGSALAVDGERLLVRHPQSLPDDLRSELGRLDDAGVQLIDRTPRPGAFGHMVAFLHPSSTGGILTELVQRTE